MEHRAWEHVLDSRLPERTKREQKKFEKSHFRACTNQNHHVFIKYGNGQDGQEKEDEDGHRSGSDRRFQRTRFAVSPEKSEDQSRRKRPDRGRQQGPFPEYPDQQGRGNGKPDRRAQAYRQPQGKSRPSGNALVRKESPSGLFSCPVKERNVNKI